MPIMAIMAIIICSSSSSNAGAGGGKYICWLKPRVLLLFNLLIN